MSHSVRAALAAIVWAAVAAAGTAAAEDKPLVIEGHDSAVTALAFSPDGKLLATGGKDQTVKLWDAATGKAVGMPGKIDWVVTCLAFARDGALLAAGTEAVQGARTETTADVFLWDVKKREPIAWKSGKTDRLRYPFTQNGPLS